MYREMTRQRPSFPSHLIPASTGIQLISYPGKRTGFAGRPRYGMRIPGSSPFLAGVRERFRDAGRTLVVITIS
ncbi:hypothetical protein ASZ90_016832 [hydrocarbon metagenome]|uniref:Uncharacterized protein n=1 Tax=hydrocarbon metagenome TaxID=938273 RepID=A0A0W8EBA0_9ZZZZ